MNAKLMKIFSSCAMAAALSFTTVAAQAAEIGSTECAEALTIGNCAANIKRIYTTEYPEQADMINEIVDTFSTDSEFINIFDSEGAKAFQIVEDSLKDSLEPSVSAQSLTAVRYSLTARAISQVVGNSVEDKYHCGPASALQALVANRKISYPSNTQSAVKTAGEKMGTNSNGTYVYQITNYMNTYESSSSVNYKSKGFTRYSYEKALDFVINSLASGRAPVMRVYNTALMSYYNGAKYSHYVTITGVDTSAGTITVVDPHFSTTYRGVHTITLSEFYNVMKGGTGLDGKATDGWLSVYSGIGGDSYTYE